MTTTQQNLAGMRFGRIVVLGYDKSSKKDSYWQCICDCGISKIIGKRHLKNTKSCGCYRNERLSIISTKHGCASTAEYKTWTGIIERCTNTKSSLYPAYGGRGIKICQEWLDNFEIFLEDMGVKPFKTASIERKDNNGDYNKDNCCWASKVEQACNRRNTIIVDWQGQKMPLTILCKERGMPDKQVWNRINILGWPVEDAINKPLDKRFGGKK